ncbi:hypothetical protein M8494_14110 [Serratia ureilytica]
MAGPVGLVVVQAASTRLARDQTEQTNFAYWHNFLLSFVLAGMRDETWIQRSR